MQLSMAVQAFTTRYLVGAAAFTFVHKVALVWSGKTQVEYCKYDRVSYSGYQMRPMLLGEKIVLVTVATLASSYLAPWILYTDLNALDVLWRGDGDTVDYDQPPRRTWLEYVL